MNMDYYILRRKIHIITSSKAPNIIFIPGIIMISKDKSFLYVSMHIFVHMYTWMVLYKQINDPKRQRFRAPMYLEQKTEIVGSGWVGSLPYHTPQCADTKFYPYICWKASPGLPKVTTQHINTNWCQLQVIFILQRKSCQISGQVPADPGQEPCHHPCPSGSNSIKKGGQQLRATPTPAI